MSTARHKAGVGLMWAVVAAAVLCLDGCAGRAELAERRVLAMVSAVERAESHDAYLRAQRRAEDLARGMSTTEVEAVMEAFVAVETRTTIGGKPFERRVTLVEGRLCVREVSRRRQRWVFGYDEGRVVFVGFVAEFERDDVDDDWELQRVDRKPDDTCEPQG